VVLLPAPRATGDWFVIAWRLVQWNLFQVWRRVLTKVLLGILLGVFVLEVAVLVFASAASDASTSGSLGAIARAQLTFPLSISLTASYAGLMGVVLLSIIAGALVGGEYGFSTQRLALSRGVSRAQALAAQVGALAILAGGVVAALMALGALIGVTIGPALGGTPGAFSVGALPQLVSFWAATTLRLLVYSLIALFLATLGRSTAAGVGGALGFMVVEVIVSNVLLAIITFQRVVETRGGQVLTAPAGPTTQVLIGVLNGFVKTNADALGAAAQLGPLNLTGDTTISRLVGQLLAPPGTLQALLVLGLYAAALIGGSFLLVQRRDVRD
jgi:ABC-type transport system involved in multi-copper enzyme maturation permease subunit